MKPANRARSLMLVLAALAAVALPGAGATQVEASLAAGSFPFTAGIVLRGLPLLDSPDLRLDAFASTRGAGLGVSFGLNLGPAGTVTASARGAYAWGGGPDAELAVRGTIGPVALAVRGLYFGNRPGTLDPLAPFALDADPAPLDVTSGFLVSASGSYRVTRNVLARGDLRFVDALSGGAAVTLGLDARVEARVEYRETAWRASVGPLVDVRPAGATFGVAAGGWYSPEDEPFTVAADAFAGVGPDGFAYGVRGSLAYALEDDLGSVTVFGAFEPWRWDVVPARFGADFEFAAGPGTAFAVGYGGFGAGVNRTGWGVRLGYRYEF